MLPKTLFLVVLLLPTQLLGQVDIESLRRNGAPEGVSGSVTASLTAETGNTDFVSVEATTRADWVTSSAATLLIAEGGLGLLSDERFSSSGLLHLRQVWWVSGWIAPEAYGQLNYDRSQLLDFRALAGAGVRLKVTEGAWGSLGAGVSLMLEREELGLPPEAVHDDRTQKVRNSTFVALRAVGGEQLVISSTTYVQPALSDPVDDLRILENLRGSVSITGYLALTVSFDLRYDSGPPDDVEPMDTKLKTGLTYSF